MKYYYTVYEDDSENRKTFCVEADTEDKADKIFIEKYFSAFSYFQCDLNVLKDYLDQINYYIYSFSEKDIIND